MPRAHLIDVGSILHPSPYRRPAINVYKVLKSKLCNVYDLSTLPISLKFVLVDTHGCYLHAYSGGLLFFFCPYHLRCNRAVGMFVGRLVMGDYLDPGSMYMEPMFK